jgi:hypothetical protein
LSCLVWLLIFVLYGHFTEILEPKDFKKKNIFWFWIGNYSPNQNNFGFRSFEFQNSNNLTQWQPNIWFMVPCI